MASNWRVVSQRQSENLTPQGTFEQVVTVTFELASGTQGKVIIPLRMYSEEYVRSQVSERAEQMAAVEELKG